MQGWNYIERVVVGLAADNSITSERNRDFLESALQLVSELPSPSKEEAFVGLVVLDAGYLVNRYPRVTIAA